MTRFAYINPARSIGMRIGIILTILIIAVVVSFGTLVSGTYSKQIREDAGEALVNNAYQLSDKVDRSIYERYRNVTQITRSRVYTDPNSTIAAKKVSVENLKLTYPEFSFVGLADTQGVVIASNSNLLLGQSVAARPWFIDAKKAKPGSLVVEDVHDAKLLAKLLPNPTGEPLRFIDIAAPIYDTNKSFTGVAAIHLSLDWINAIRTSLLRPAEVKRKMEVIITNNVGDVLLGPDNIKGKNIASLQAFKAASNSNPDGWTKEKWQDGNEYVTGYYASRGYSSYPGIGWRMFVRQPVSEAYATINQLQQWATYTTIAVGTLVVIITAFVIARSLRNIRIITKAASQIQAGDITDLPPIKGRDEIATLASTLSNLIHSLREKQKLENENDKLGRVNKLMVDREIKMVELKEKLRKAERK